jgi:F-type H+-transporting ATPase subunit epsilon
MAGNTFKFELVSPERVLISIDAEQVVVPGADGEFAVLPGHAPVIATLRPGVLDVTAGGTRRRLFVKSGFAEVEPSRLTVLAEKAYDVEELSASVIASELKSAEAELAAAQDDNRKMMADTLISELKRLGASTA